MGTAAGGPLLGHALVRSDHVLDVLAELGPAVGEVPGPPERGSRAVSGGRRAAGRLDVRCSEGTGPTSVARTVMVPPTSKLTAADRTTSVAAGATRSSARSIDTGRLATAVSAVSAVSAGRASSAVAVLLSAYAIWNGSSPVPVRQYVIVFLAVVLPLTFLLYRWALLVLCRTAPAERPSPPAGSDAYISRGFAPSVIDVVCGRLLVALLTESGWSRCARGRRDAQVAGPGPAPRRPARGWEQGVRRAQARTLSRPSAPARRPGAAP